MLAALRCDFGGISGMSLGIVGIGGASSGTVAIFLLGEEARFGEGVLNVRSVIEPADPLLSSWLPGRPTLGALPLEDTDPFLAMRLV